MYHYLAKYVLDHYRYPRLSEDELMNNQLVKMNKLIRFSGRYVSFYKSLYKNAGVLETTIRYPEDMDKIPIVTKSDFRNAKPNELASAVRLGNLNEHYTSGSTGEPFLVRSTKEAEYTAHIRIFLTLAKYGYRPNNSMLMLFRYEADTKLQVEQDLRILKLIQTKLGLFKREIVSIFENADKIIEKLESLSPQVFVSTPGVLSVLIKRLRERQIKFHIPLIFLMAEPISPVFLQELHDYLGDTVIDMYGCMECPSIGYEINGSGIRNVFTESCFLELQNELTEKEGYSKVILSNLLNFAQPVIRYSVNDLAINVENRNKGVRRLGRIIGRIEDIITTTDGTVIAFHHVYEMFSDFKECKQFQLVQKGNSITLRLIVDEQADKKHVMTKARERLLKRYPQTKIDIEFVSEIKPDPKTGKIKNIEVIS